MARARFTGIRSPLEIKQSQASSESRQHCIIAELGVTWRPEYGQVGGLHCDPVGLYRYLLVPEADD